jgi:hypothetical protein
MLSSNPGSTLFYVGFDNPTEGGGIPAGSSFTIDLNDLIEGKPNTDPNGRGQWSYPDTFTAMANQTPEPGTLALLAAGFGLLLAGLAYRALRLRSPRPIA